MPGATYNPYTGSTAATPTTGTGGANVLPAGSKLPSGSSPNGYTTIGPNAQTPNTTPTNTSNPSSTLPKAPVLPTASATIPAVNSPSVNTPSPSMVVPGSPGNDPSVPSASQVQGATNTLGQNQSELENSELSAEDYAVSRSQSLINDVSSVYSDELAKAASNAEGSEAAGGQGGGPVGASAEYMAIQPILNQQSAAVAGEIQSIQNNAASVFENTESAAQTNATDTLSNNNASKLALQQNVANMAAVGYTASQLQEQNPDEYDYLLNYAYNGDANAMNSAFLNGAKGTLLNSGQPVYTSPDGKSQTYAQMTVNPDGSPSLKYTTVQLPYTSVPGWTTTKISTTSSMEVDPNNPGNMLVITTDPLTGAPTFMGSGTGAALAAQFNQQNSGSSSDSSSSSATPPSGALSTTMQNYVSTASTTAGVADPTQPFTTIVNGDGKNDGIGIAPIINGIHNAEGGSPAGVTNNPGNVLYVSGMSGATDSGVHPTNNPNATFASFDTKEDGDSAIASTVQHIASNLGPNASLQDVLNTYVNGYGNTPSTSTNSTDSVGSNGLSTAQYGLLSNVQGFDPGPTTGVKTDAQAIDNAAFNYLQVYLKTGNQPTNTNVLGMRSGSAAELPTIAQRAEELYTKATGQSMPDQDILNSNKGFIEANNGLLNSLAVQEQTISANSDLLQQNINSENINQYAPVINEVLNGITSALGSPNVASSLAQNSTLSNELGSLLALKNASGTTVHDKLISADLISPNASAEQEAAVVNTLMKEATNAHAAILKANAQLYIQNDPLGLDPQNPIANPVQFSQSIGLDLSSIQKDYPDMTPSEIITQYINSQ